MSVLHHHILRWKFVRLISLLHFLANVYADSPVYPNLYIYPPVAISEVEKVVDVRCEVRYPNFDICSYRFMTDIHEEANDSLL